MNAASGSTAGPPDAVDFAVAAYREEGAWQVASLPPGAVAEIDTFLQALAQLPADAGVLGMVSVEDDYFILARVSGPEERLLLSDIGAATESPLAGSVVERLELPPPDDDDDHVQPAGDLGIIADLGLSAMDLGEMCDDEDLYPDEVLADIADNLGFGTEFEQAVDSVSA